MRQSISKPPDWRGWPVERLERGWLRKQPSREGVLKQESSWSDSRTIAQSVASGGECQPSTLSPRTDVTNPLLPNL